MPGRRGPDRTQPHDFRILTSRQLLSSAIRHAKFIAAAYGFWDESLYTDQIIRPAVLKAYWGFALANFKLGYSPELEDRLRKTGIGFLFDWNRELIEGAALAGLCAASGLSVEELPSTFASYELDLLATMEGLEVMRQKYGIPLAFLVDDVYIISL